jgi:hypothetical protein
VLYLGPREHQSTYDRIIVAAMRYSAVVNYAEAVEIPLLSRHPVLPSSSASTAALQPMPATLAGGFSAPTAQQQPQAQGPHTYVQRSFVPPAQVLLVDLIFNKCTQLLFVCDYTVF